MPVHSPGSRLYSSVPLKHVVPKGHGGGGANGNIALNLTPFVDMMTILVTFLLMVFSASGDILMSQKGLELPEATNKDVLQRAPVIIITQDAITFNGEHMADVEALINDTTPQWKVVELFERMKTEKRLFTLNFEDLPESEKARCDPGFEQKSGLYCLDGLAILQADKAVPAKVINRILKTANAAGYGNIMFAVNRRASRSG